MNVFSAPDIPDYPYPTLPGGARVIDLHSLNGLAGLGMILGRSGDYVDPLNWRQGIQGLGLRGLRELQTWPGSGGSSALLANPFMGMGDLVKTLTPGLHGIGGMMQFPGSGGSDALVRNPINPTNAHAWYVGRDDLGGDNKLADAMVHPAEATMASAGSNVVAVDSTSAAAETTSVLTSLYTAAHALGLAGIGDVGKIGCGSCENGSGLSGLGDAADVADSVYLSTGLDFSWDGSLIPGVSNSVLYLGAGGLLAFGLLFKSSPRYSPKYKTVRRFTGFQKNPGRRQRRRHKWLAA
jgi:hypothetical protein